MGGCPTPPWHRSPSRIPNRPSSTSIYPTDLATFATYRTLATLFGSSLFPGRLQPPFEDDIVAAVDRDLRTMMLIRPEVPPPKVLGVRVWPNAIPQYELGHLDTMAELKRMEDANDVVGLWVCGSNWTGVSLTACVNFGHDHAKVVAGHLTSKRRVRDADVKEAPSLTQVNYIEFIWSNHEQPCMLKLQSSSMILYKTFCYTATYSHSSPLSLINSIGVY